MIKDLVGLEAASGGIGLYSLVGPNKPRLETCKKGGLLLGWLITTKKSI